MAAPRLAGTAKFIDVCNSKHHTEQHVRRYGILNNAAIQEVNLRCNKHVHFKQLYLCSCLLQEAEDRVEASKAPDCLTGRCEGANAELPRKQKYHQP